MIHERALADVMVPGDGREEAGTVDTCKFPPDFLPPPQGALIIMGLGSSMFSCRDREWERKNHFVAQ